MSWAIVPKVKKLIFTYGGEDHVIENALGAEAYDYATLLSNPYQDLIFNRNGETTGNEESRARYAEIDGCLSGDFDIWAIYNLLANNETGYIWREEMGRYIRITLKRTYQTMTIGFYNYGRSVAPISLSIVPNTGTLDKQWKGIGFLIDIDNNQAGYYIVECSHYKYSLVDKMWYQSLTGTGNISATNKSIVSSVMYCLLSQNLPPEPPTPSSDPYADGGYSTGTDTGTGTFDDTSESVPLPTTYALSATAAGIMSQYVLTEANLAAFGSWLWNGGTIVDDLKHFFQSPMEAIFSVGILPFTPSDTTQYNVYVGALAATGVQGGHVNDTVEKISCGSITFDGYYGGALDYNPYTKIELFLPYCGTLTLNPDEVMGHTISVDYYCDTITGDCVAFVSDEERVLHQVRGNCFIQIPLAARDFTALYSSAIAAIGTIAAGLATAASGGLSAPVAVGMGSSMAANAMNAKTHIARAGGVSGMAGFMSIQTPYVIMSIPNQCLPEFQNDFQGYPLFVTKRLGDFSGFTKVYEIHLDGLDCTDAEAKEIYELLKGGVVL